MHMHTIHACLRGAAVPFHTQCHRALLLLCAGHKPTPSKWGTGTHTHRRHTYSEQVGRNTLTREWMWDCKAGAAEGAIKECMWSNV
eukprot:1159623-Pelagomonas_calceolata.AAC.8